MELYPAVDIQGGRIARSASGDDPLAVARGFAQAGARWVHVVDLDRVLGTGENRALTRELLAADIGARVQVGGAPAPEEAIVELFEWGAARIVLGALLASDGARVRPLLARYGPDRVAVGIDARNGRVAPRGSGRTLAITPLELADQVRTLGVRTVVYTDAARDGALAGPDIDGAHALAELGLDVIASGGVASLDDLRRARDAGLAGAIVGRALHEGRFTLREALACVAA